DMSWRYLGSPDPARTTVGDTAILRTAAGGVVVYAVAGGKLYRRSAPSNSAWEEIQVVAGGDQTEVARITPIFRAEAPSSDVTLQDGLAVIDAGGDLFSCSGRMVGFKKGAGGLDPAVYPLVISAPSGARRKTYVFAASRKPGELLAFTLPTRAKTTVNPKTIS